MSRKDWKTCNFENCTVLTYKKKLCKKHHNLIFRTGLLGWQFKLKKNEKNTRIVRI